MTTGLARKTGTVIAAAALAFGMSACSADVNSEGDGTRVDADLQTPNLPDVDVDVDQPNQPNQ